MKDYKLLIWTLIFWITAYNNSLIKISMDNWGLNLFQTILLLLIFIQSIYVVNIILAKKIDAQVIEPLYVKSKMKLSLIALLFNLKRVFFFVTIEEKRRMIVNSIFPSPIQAPGVNEFVKCYLGFGSKIRMIDKYLLFFKLLSMISLSILLFYSKIIFNFFKEVRLD